MLRITSTTISKLWTNLSFNICPVGLGLVLAWQLIYPATHDSKINIDCFDRSQRLHAYLAGLIVPDRYQRQVSCRRHIDAVVWLKF